MLPQLMRVSMMAPLCCPVCWPCNACNARLGLPTRSGEGTDNDLERFFRASSRSISISATRDLNRSTSETNPGSGPAVWELARLEPLELTSPSLHATWPCDPSRRPAPAVRALICERLMHAWHSSTWIAKGHSLADRSAPFNAA